MNFQDFMRKLSESTSQEELERWALEHKTEIEEMITEQERALSPQQTEKYRETLTLFHSLQKDGTFYQWVNKTFNTKIK